MTEKTFDQIKKYLINTGSRRQYYDVKKNTGVLILAEGRVIQFIEIIDKECLRLLSTVTVSGCMIISTSSAKIFEVYIKGK